MSTVGSVPPAMAETPEGFMMFVPKSLGDGAEKDKSANAGRLFAVGYKATAVAMALEDPTWNPCGKISKNLPLTPARPSRNLDS